MEISFKSIAASGVLTIIGLLWLVFSLIGWGKFSIIEILLSFLLFVFSFLRFLNSNSHPMMAVKSREDAFRNYNDQEELKRLSIGPSKSKRYFWYYEILAPVCFKTSKAPWMLSLKEWSDGCETKTVNKICSQQKGVKLNL